MFPNLFPGAVINFEARYLQAGMIIIRNDRPLKLTRVEYNEGQAPGEETVDYFFMYEDEDPDDNTGEWFNFFLPDEMIKVLYYPGNRYPLHALL